MKRKEYLEKTIDFDDAIARIVRLEKEAEPREKRIEELEKENAELKTKVTALENANRAMVKELDDTTSGGLNILQNVVKNKEELTKAKEIIKYLLSFIQKENYKTRWDINIAEAEQFIKDSEVEK